MHEHALIHRVVEAIQADPKLAPGVRVLEVRLKIGVLELHSEAAFRQGFAVAVQGTPLSGARLELVVMPVTLECAACGHRKTLGEGEIDPHNPFAYTECPACGAAAALTGGRGVEGIELVVDDG